MKKIIILAALCILFKVEGQEASRFEASLVATKTLQGLSRNVSMQIIDSVYSLERQGNVILYEVVYNSGESVLLSGNKLCKPIIGYSLPDGVSTDSPVLSDFEELPQGLKEFLSNYIEQIENSYTLSGNRIPHQEWNIIQSDSVTRRNRLIRVGPLTETEWGQWKSNCGTDNNAYNFYVDGYCSSTQHCYAGCGPVALAQIMYYWKFPVWDALSKEQFDWCNMTTYLDTNASNYYKKRSAIAKLIRECGTYATYCDNNCETSMSFVDCRNVLLRYGYFCSNIKEKDGIDETDWIQMIKDNIDNKQPILYKGENNTSGHAFICDGYDNSNMFHFNWGANGGYYYYWFTLNNLNPGSNYYFTLDQEAIFDIRPSGEQDYCDFTIPLEAYYFLYFHFFGNTEAPFDITPKTFTTLKSVQDTNIYPSSWRTIPADATAEYVAHKEIVLQPGFTAEYGSDFTARIEPCAACEERMMQVTLVGDSTAEADIDTSGLEQRLYRSGDKVFAVRPSDITLFPNPAEHTITVQTPDEVKAIQIFDLSGRPVYRWYIASRTRESLTIDIADIPSGTYILQLTTANGQTHVGRFVKN